MENARDIAKSFEQREKVDGGSFHHTLKLALGDGRQTVRFRTSARGAPQSDGEPSDVFALINRFNVGAIIPFSLTVHCTFATAVLRREKGFFGPRLSPLQSQCSEEKSRSKRGAPSPLVHTPTHVPCRNSAQRQSRGESHRMCVCVCV